jgi:hypothetical protein
MALIKPFDGTNFDPLNPAHRPPYIKGKNFCPNPIVVNGIPRYADSIADPKVVGTAEWEMFWEEELRRIHNGYQTGGYWIPGRYYYYLNYSVISTVDRGNITLDVVDMHMELAYLIEYCKQNGKNLMIPKARRKGISEATHKMVIDYGWRFLYSYKCGIASGQKGFVKDFIAKLRYGWQHLQPELYVGTLLDNNDEIIAGLEEKNVHGAFEEAGTKNQIYLKTIHTDATGFKGNFYNDIIVEEIGETEKFLEFWSATREAMSDGFGSQVGCAFCYGTGGDINKGSKAFKEAWSRNKGSNFIDTNNFIRYVIPAQRFYFYGGASLKRRDIPATSELRKNYKPYQLLGVEDVPMSLAEILRIRESKKDGPRKGYLEYMQENPTNEQEIFKKSVINNFDTVKINDRMSQLDAAVHPPWTKYKFDYVKDDKGMIKQPVQVKKRVLESHEDPNICVWIADGGDFTNSHIGRYVAGIDSYNIDRSTESKSLGAMLVLDRITKKPVAAICCRPQRKEIFFEMCIMLSVYYKMYYNVLGDVGSDTIIKHFEQVGCYNYLADRPKKFESEGSSQSHEKWVRLTDYSRPRMVGLMQAHVNDYCDQIDFPELLDQLGNYDEVARDSDNDLADAYGIALMQDISCEIRPKNMEENVVKNRFELTQFEDDGRGGLRKKGAGGGLRDIQEDSDLMWDMFGPPQ